MAAHFAAHKGGSGNCALCGKHSDDLWIATRDGSIKRRGLTWSAIRR